MKLPPSISDARDALLPESPLALSATFLRNNVGDSDCRGHFLDVWNRTTGRRRGADLDAKREAFAAAEAEACGAAAAT